MTRVRPRDNPFAVQRIAALRHHLEAADWQAIERRLVALAFRGALVAPEGHGKSRLLAALADRLAAQGFRPRRIQLAAGERWLISAHRATLLADAQPQDLLLVDGAEQLAPLAWRWLRWRSRSARGLLITSHVPGLLPTLWEPSTSPALLATLVGELLASAAARPPIGDSPVSAQLPALPDLDSLWRHHRGNLRDALLALYDHSARG